MAQDEEMKRLLLKGKRVGYQLHTFTNSEGIYHSRTPEIINNTEEDGGGSDLKLGNNILFAEGNTTEGLGFPNYIEHDSFELGIKVKGEWWFEGDIIEFDIEDTRDRRKGILSFEDYTWQLNTHMHFGNETHMWNLITFNCAKHIGNIHDNPELMEEIEMSGVNKTT